MLNTLCRHLTRTAKISKYGAFSRGFCSSLRFKSNQKNQIEDFVLFKPDDTLNEEQVAEDDKELELDLEHLKASLYVTDDQNLSYSTNGLKDRIKALADKDFNKVIQNQDIINSLSVTEFLEALEIGLLTRLQEMVESPEIRLSTKIRIMMFKEDLQTIENLKIILSEAFDQNYDDDQKQLIILIGAATNSSADKQQQISDHLRAICGSLELQSVSPSLLSLAFSLNSKIMFATEEPLEKPKKTKVKKVSEKVNHMASNTGLISIVDERMIEPMLSNVSRLTIKNVLDIIKLRQEKNNSSAKEEIDNLQASLPSLNLIKLLDYDQSLLLSLSYEQKLALFWIYSKLLTNPKFTDKHKTGLQHLLHNLLMYDLAMPSYLIRTMMERCRIMDESLLEKVNRVSHNDQILDTPSIIQDEQFAEGCTIFARRDFGSVRGDKRRILAQIPDIFAHMPTMLSRAILYLNVSSYVLRSEKFKRGTMYHMIGSSVESLDPTNVAEIESLCYILIGSLEIKRSIKFTMYVHNTEAERIMKVATEAFLKEHADLITKLVSKSSKLLAKQEPWRQHLILLCLLAKIKFEIHTPVMDNISKLLPEMNDFTFATSFSAIDQFEQLEALVDELKVRLKPGSGFQLLFINIILGSFKFRSKICLHQTNGSIKQTIRYDEDLTLEQLLNLPTAKNPNLLPFTESSKKLMPVIMSIVEKYFLTLVKKKAVCLVNTHYMDVIVARDIFSPNEYRNPKTPFCFQRPEKFYVSQEEIYLFFKLCNFINYSTVHFWEVFQHMTLALLGKQNHLEMVPLKNAHLTWGTFRTLLSMLCHQQITNHALWQTIEEKVLECFQKVIFVDHLDIIHSIIRYFAISREGSGEFWAVIEALTHVVWEMDVDITIKYSLIASLMKRGRVISSTWLNNAIAQLLRSNPPEEILRSFLIFSSPRLVQAKNFHEIVHSIKQLGLEVAQESMDGKKVQSNDRFKIALERRCYEFKKHLSTIKTPEQRAELEEELTLFPN